MKDKPPTLEELIKAIHELGETVKKVDDYFAEQERRKKRPWWKKIFDWD
jgi:hypothetical protein